MAIEQANIDHWFKYHTPDADDIVAYGNMRNKAKELAECILANTPPSADQTVAIRLLRECIMTANAARALKGKQHG